MKKYWQLYLSNYKPVDSENKSDCENWYHSSNSSPVEEEPTFGCSKC